MKFKEPVIVDLSIFDLILLLSASLAILLFISQIYYLRHTATATENTAKLATDSLRLTKLTMSKMLYPEDTKKQ